MVSFNECDEVRVIRVAEVRSIVVLDKNAFVLEADDCYAIAVVVYERTET